MVKTEVDKDKSKFVIQAPFGWRKILEDFIEKNSEFIDIQEAVRCIVRSYIVNAENKRKKILSEYDEGYIQGYADAMKINPRNLLMKGFEMVTQK